MNCPVCGGKCSQQRISEDPGSIRRYRICRDCGYKFRTVEVDEDYFEKHEKMVIERAVAMAKSYLPRIMV